MKPLLASCLLGLLMAGCQPASPSIKTSTKPAATPEPLPAWTRAVGGKGGGKVRVELKLIEVVYEAGTSGIPGKRYEKRLNPSQREDYLRRLMQQKGADLMSTPVIITRDGQVAHAEVGRRLQFPTDSARMEEVTLGTSVHVRPRYATHGRTLTLDVLAEVKELEGFHQPESGPEQPVVTSRRLESTTTLSDGETLLLGGLVTREEQAVEDKVPVLGDIPVLGGAFRSKDTYEFARELRVLVTVKRTE